jgi:hypothetical protein
MLDGIEIAGSEKLMTSDTAERRIEACQRDRDDYLNLSGLRLHVLPESLFGLTWLTALDLSGPRR